MTIDRSVPMLVRVACGLAIAALSLSAGPAPWSPGKERSGAELSLAPAGEPGKRFTLEGRILGLPDSLPVRDATVYLYHADAHGRYSLQGESRPRLAGTVHTDAAGGFRVRTILPGQYDGTPHLHLRLSGEDIHSEAATLSLARSHGAGSDTAYDRVPWMVKLPGEYWTYVEPDGDGGYISRWTVYVKRSGRP